MGLITALTSRGWRVLPLWEKDETGRCACRDADTCRDKHPRVAWQNPRDGRSGATTDPDVIRGWREAWPDCDWAMVLDDVFVVDVDVKHGGMETLAGVEVDLPELLYPTLTQVTPSGGRQLFYRQPQDGPAVVTLPQGRLRELPGFEIKGRTIGGGVGHYVGVPPSCGREWLRTGEPAEATELLLDVIRRGTLRAAGAIGEEVVGGGGGLGGGGAFNWNTALVPGAILYGQDDALYRAALSLRSQGVSDSLAHAVLRRMIECFVNTDPDDPWEPERAEQKWEYVKRRFLPGRSEIELPAGAARWLGGAARRNGARVPADAGTRTTRVTLIGSDRRRSWE